MEKNFRKECDKHLNYKSPFDLTASRERFIGFNISKLRFEDSDRKYVEVKGQAKNCTKIEIRGSEEKKITYKPFYAPVQPASPDGYSENVIVQYK